MAPLKTGSYNLSCTIINVNGSFIGTPTSAGYVGIIYNFIGAWIVGFSDFISDSNEILHAKLLGIYQGLSIANNTGILNSVCYSDSSLCFNLIKTPMLIQNIKDLLYDNNQ
jgi:ribonuclease HI